MKLFASMLVFALVAGESQAQYSLIVGACPGGNCPATPVRTMINTFRVPVAQYRVLSSSCSGGQASFSSGCSGSQAMFMMVPVQSYGCSGSQATFGERRAERRAERQAHRNSGCSGSHATFSYVPVQSCVAAPQAAPAPLPPKKAPEPAPKAVAAPAQAPAVQMASPCVQVAGVRIMNGTVYQAMPKGPVEKAVRNVEANRPHIAAKVVDAAIHIITFGRR